MIFLMHIIMVFYIAYGIMNFNFSVHFLCPVYYFSECFTLIFYIVFHFRGKRTTKVNFDLYENKMNTFKMNLVHICSISIEKVDYT